MNQATMIPALEPHCGSWVIVCRHTRNPVREVFDRRLLERMSADDFERFEVLTAAQWLAEFNRSVA